MMSHCTVATYVKIGFNVVPCLRVISLLIMVSAGHQGIADSGWHSFHEVTVFM
jgi:hypothetical protein